MQNILRFAERSFLKGFSKPDSPPPMSWPWCSAQWPRVEWGSCPRAPSLEFMADDYLENSFKKQRQAFSLLFLGEIHVSVIVWKNAQSFHCVTLKGRQFPREEKNKANCNTGKWDRVDCFRELLFKLPLPHLQHQLCFFALLLPFGSSYHDLDYNHGSLLSKSSQQSHSTDDKVEVLVPS